MSCPYDCYTCDSAGKCLSCNDTNDFRVLVTDRCGAMMGYFDNLVRVCVLCPNACSGCQSLTYCTSCKNGNYLRADDQCYTTCLSGFYPDSNTNTCKVCPTGCKLCSSGTVCSICQTGYFILNNVCLDVCPARYFASN